MWNISFQKLCDQLIYKSADIDNLRNIFGESKVQIHKKGPVQLKEMTIEQFGDKMLWEVAA